MKPESEVDPRALDQLVDGELKGASRRDLLTSLDQTEGGWKQCAMAFLEAQSWQFALRSQVDAGSSDNPTAAETTNLEAKMAQHSAVTDSQHRDAVDTGRPWRHWLSLAACMLIAFTLGTRLQRSTLPPDTPNDVVGTGPSTANTPQWASNSAPDIWRGESMLPHEMEDELQRLGLKVDREQGFMPVVSDQGQRFIVPYENLKIQQGYRHPQ